MASTPKLFFSVFTSAKFYLMTFTNLSLGFGASKTNLCVMMYSINQRTCSVHENRSGSILCTSHREGDRAMALIGVEIQTLPVSKYLAAWAPGEYEG